MRPIRWGILGTGGIARAFATALQDTPHAVLAAVGSRSIDSARAFGMEFGAPQSFGSYEALCAAPDIDIIYIGTPHPLHARNALMALEGGKAVLCEKPFTMNLREARQVVASARARKLFLMEAMWTRFMPALAEVKRIIDSGLLGVISQVHADFGFAGTCDPEHRINKRELGGGALLDLGIYPLSISHALLGPVVSVQAQAVLSDGGIDLTTGWSMKHASGAMSICSCSLRARTPCELTVSGTLGSVRMDAMFHLAERITLTLGDGIKRVIETPYLGNGYVHEAIEAGRCLRAGLTESPHMLHDDTLALMGLMDTIRTQIGVHYPADQ
ncbi:Gfo/Idh/MocA family protein [Massilia sp. TSP1-1-2]|uniref:Gfo/Idh/MocA family protein n=1 Tax=unclassified Massilia TaxID=2609279 RepID=UPI003CF2A0A1